VTVRTYVMTCCKGGDLMEKMERFSGERGFSSREENIQSSVTTMMRIREYGIGNCNAPPNGKYTQ